MPSRGQKLLMLSKRRVTSEYFPEGDLVGTHKIGCEAGSENKGGVRGVEEAFVVLRKKNGEGRRVAIKQS